MSAFGRRPGTAGRPAFGVAKPMQTGPGVPGGAQFPAIDAAAPEPSPAAPSPEQEAMERLNQRSTAEMAAPEKAQGYEAAIPKAGNAPRGDRGGNYGESWGDAD